MVSQNNDERELIRRSKKGDKNAFGKLVGKYESKIYGLCYHMLLHQEDAEDAAQETFFRAYKKIRGFRENSKFYTWLRRVAVNYCIDVLRGRKRGEKEVPMINYDRDDDTISLEDIIPSPDDNPYNEYIQKVEEEKRQQCIKRLLVVLSPDQRAVVELLHFQELSYEEVAAMLNRPIGTIKSRCNRAFDKLREQLKECKNEKQCQN